ncbi:MAG: thioredoxin [Schaedlerella sp.]|nr:CD1871A family CXXC motif-containing protein [uncultured Schaedlerella sp.]
MGNFLRSSRAGLLIAAAGLAMMGAGICRGEMAVVMEKAINICLECIGIG